MSLKPVDVEVSLDKKPSFGLKIDEHLMPMGPNANLKQIKLTSNPKVDTKVEKVYGDVDLKAEDALIYLYQNNFDENFLNRLLSIGTLGVKKDRKLVPTRWAISAVDDMLAKHLIEEISFFNEVDYSAYFGGYLGNYFLILSFPGSWSYELFETYLPKSSWNTSNEISFTTDYENYYGRKTYAENCGGGYYASRLPVLERLKEMKRKGSVLVLRFITGDYAVPLGVWVVRESVRKAVSSKPLNFSDKELLLNYARALIKKKFGYDADNLLRESKILSNMKSQTRLANFFT
jgi:hypothetical protein